MEQIFVTFGIAVYNVANFLPRCIESVLCQQGRDVEILLVDDGSTDESGTICDFYAKKDPRIRVIHRQNGGISSVRNEIIARARGQWLCFVDGDDRLTADALAVMRRAAQPQLDLIKFDWLFFRRDDAVPAYTAPERQQFFSDPKTLAGLAAATLYTTNQTPSLENRALRSVCATLFRTEFLRRGELRFCEELRMGEDLEFSLRCLASCRAALVVSHPVYLYRRHTASAVQRYRPDIVLDNTALIQALRQSLSAFSVRQALLLECYYLRCLTELTNCLKMNYCNPQNPDSYDQRARGAIALSKLPWCHEALENVFPQSLTRTDHITYDALKNGAFREAHRYFTAVAKKERRKQLLSKFGITKALLPLRDRLLRKQKG